MANAAGEPTMATAHLNMARRWSKIYHLIEKMSSH
jgi:hypothetical protein